MSRRFVLASASAARLRLLQAAGLDPTVVVSGIDETTVAGMSPEDMARELAVAKALKVAATQEDSLVLGCDSVLELDGTAYGKPATPEEAVQRWHHMRGRQGTLLTGHCICDSRTGTVAEAVCATLVWFGRPTDEEIDAYVATGEPLAVAGGFTLDGRSAPFIEGVDGDPGNVIGVSLSLVRDLLGELGVRITDLWR
jgi:septum formation protein